MTTAITPEERLSHLEAIFPHYAIRVLPPLFPHPEYRPLLYVEGIYMGSSLSQVLMGRGVESDDPEEPTRILIAAIEDLQKSEPVPFATTLYLGSFGAISERYPEVPSFLSDLHFAMQEGRAFSRSGWRCTDRTTPCGALRPHVLYQSQGEQQVYWVSESVPTDVSVTETFFAETEETLREFLKDMEVEGALIRRDLYVRQWFVP